MTKQEQLKIAFATIIKDVLLGVTSGFDDGDQSTVDETVNELLKEVSIRTDLK